MPWTLRHPYVSALLLLVAVSALDYATGIELGFTAFYVLPVALLAWRAGAAPGMVAAGAAAMAWFLVDLAGGRALSHPGYRFWDAANHGISYALLAFVLGRLKGALDALKASNEGLVRALGEVRELKGLLPICAWCKRIRDDEGYWEEVSTYLTHHTHARFTHGICPECNRKLLEDGEP